MKCVVVLLNVHTANDTKILKCIRYINIPQCSFYLPVVIFESWSPVRCP